MPCRDHKQPQKCFCGCFYLDINKFIPIFALCSHKKMKRFLGILGLLFAAAGCYLVDEDLSNCPDELNISYEMRLITNVQTEINTVLSLDADISVATALRTYLKDIFSDHAHDVDLSFYDVDEPMPVLHHFTDIIDANQTSYILHIPVRKYMHLAVANIMDNTQVNLKGEELCHSSNLLQKEGKGDPKVIDPHTTGLFTARLPMDILGNVSQTFNVNLYMANCATALVVDNTAEGTPEISDFKAFTTGFASSFNIADSTYFFDSNTLVRADHIPVEGNAESLYATVQFPSREPEPESKVVIETIDPFVSDSTDKVLWEWIIYVTLPDGSITESRLHFVNPLRAGQLRIIRVRILPDGSASTDDTSVGASVTLDWKQGSSHEIPL